MIKKIYNSGITSAYLLSAAVVLLFSTNALANLPTVGKGGDDKSKSGPVATFLFPEKEWVIVEVIDQEEKADEATVVNIEKKNISQVPVTKIEVRNCKQNGVPDELAPLMQQIPTGRKVYRSEEEGKTVYYISPVQEPVKEEEKDIDPASLSFPLFWNMKI